MSVRRPAGGESHVRTVLRHMREDAALPGAGAGGYDFDEGGSDGPAQQHFPAAELDPSVPCRNPMDPHPYPESELLDTESISFPSLFLPVESADSKDGNMAHAELKDSWNKLQVLVRECLETQSPQADTVDMVYQFYNEHIRSSFTDAGEWSKKSIYFYIYSDHDRQAAEAINGVNATMEFLRSQLATRKEDGSIKVNAENVKLFLASTKVHAGLLDAKRKREQR